MTDPRARLPGLSALLERPEVAAAVRATGHARVVAELRGTLAEARATAATGGEIPSAAQLAARALVGLDGSLSRRLRPVLNATGVLLHTNLGRAPLSPDAIAAVTAAAGPTNLELDLVAGRRGGRGTTADDALARLTGAEAAMVVNNGAAALVLALHVLGRGREVVISRGELVEIGGSFRLPDIMETAGCVLHEVGTTNRTHVEDYRRAVGHSPAALLRVHPSNYHLDGFVHRPTTRELAGVAHAAGVPLIVDIGSGLLRAHPTAPDEPVASTAVADGADLVTFSGDKLLGGPQAGVVVGRGELVDRCRAAPLARALRIDKLRLAALEATLSSHERSAGHELPVWALAEVDIERLRERAERLAARCGGRVLATDAVLGGGSTPANRLASFGVAVPGDAETVAQRLRTGDPAVLGRIIDDQLVIDLRAVPADRDQDLAAAVDAATAANATNATNATP